MTIFLWCYSFSQHRKIVNLLESPKVMNETKAHDISGNRIVYIADRGIFCKFKRMRNRYAKVNLFFQCVSGRNIPCERRSIELLL